MMTTIDSNGLYVGPLRVGGYLDLRGTPITQLPDGLSVGGYLDLSGTQITQLPDGLSVGGGLDLSGTPITQLPDGLSVEGSLYLSGTQITQLPDGLSVGGSLDLRGTPITQLPRDIRLGGRGVDDAPVIANIHQAVYAAASQPGSLNMSEWHCGSAHCRAGWVVTLAGAAGAALEAEIGTSQAAYLIYAASDPARPLPDFYATNEAALADMKLCAEREAA